MRHLKHAHLKVVKLSFELDICSNFLVLKALYSVQVSFGNFSGAFWGWTKQVLVWPVLPSSASWKTFSFLFFSNGRRRGFGGLGRDIPMLESYHTCNGKNALLDGLTTY